MVSWVDVRKWTYTDAGEIGASIAPKSAADRKLAFPDKGPVE